MARKKTLKQLQDLIWVECRRIIRARYEHTCYSCGEQNLFGANLHTGHMIAKKFLKNCLKYDLRLLRPQCYNCNINLGGLGALFIENMREREGDLYVAEILADLDKEIEKSKLFDYYSNLLEYLKEIKK